MTATTIPQPSGDEPTAAPAIGPPVLILVAGALSVVVSLALVVKGTTLSHVLGYLTGSLLPIFAIGFFRRLDLERRKSPNYRSANLRGSIVPALAIGGVIAAAIHAWSLATYLAS